MGHTGFTEFAPLTSVGIRDTTEIQMTGDDDLLADARQRVAGAARLLAQFGIRGQTLPDCPVGCGFGVPRNDGSWSLISAMGGDNAVNITVGVLKNLRHEREAILNECNARTRDSGLPLFLHDAEAGWDLLLQARFPAYVMDSSADYFAGLVNGLPELAAAAGAAVRPFAGGEPFGWNAEDTNRLLVRSLL